MWLRDAVVVYTHISPLFTTESPVAQWLEYPYWTMEGRGFKSHLGLGIFSVASQLLQGLTWLETTLTLNKRTNNRNNGP